MSNGENKGKKRTKSFYRKSAYGSKRHRGVSNILEPGITGFLVMCNSNENIAVKECYNILNEYADKIYGQEQVVVQSSSSSKNKSSDEDSECEDAEIAMQKEINSIKNTTSAQRRFQNVMTKAKNCVFIRSTVADPVKITLNIMEDIAQHGLKKARYAARVLPIVGTCKAHTSDIEKLAKDVLFPIFSKDNAAVPSSYTIQFKVRNNNASTCSRTSVIPVLTKVVSEINPSVKFSWSNFEVAVLVEVVCTVCCLGVAPGYIRLRKYNLQELVRGPKTYTGTEECVTQVSDKSTAKKELSCEEERENKVTADTASEKVDEKFNNQLMETVFLETSDSVKVVKLNSVSSDEQLQQNETIIIAPDNKVVCDTVASETVFLETSYSVKVVKLNSVSSDEQLQQSETIIIAPDNKVVCDTVASETVFLESSDSVKVVKLNSVSSDEQLQQNETIIIAPDNKVVCDTVASENAASNVTEMIDTNTSATSVEVSDSVKTCEVVKISGNSDTCEIQASKD